MTTPNPVSIRAAFDALTFVGDRTPHSTDAELARAFATLADYRDGGVFVGHWAGTSEWERHSAGDELVLVVEGEARLTLLVQGERVTHRLGAGQLLVVPQGTWHHFVVPERVQVLTVTPQPTDHSVELPLD